MKFLFHFVLLTLVLKLPAQKVLFEEYFPLKNGMVQTYFVSHITETDILPDDPEKKIFRYQTIKSKNIYYLTDDVKEKEGDTCSIGSESFPNGVFYYDNGNFMFSPISWKYELKEANLNYFEILFPKTISIDSAYRCKDGYEKRKYTFVGFETIGIKGSVIDSCLKLILEQDWPTTHYEDTIWFKRNVGVVKWLRSTGRLEELEH